jgi:hypothetical protein
VVRACLDEAKEFIQDKVNLLPALQS